ncbi:MAG: hypothetical protein ACREXW_14085 [Gammaproteobacteria bacterium]
MITANKLAALCLNTGRTYQCIKNLYFDGKEGHRGICEAYELNTKLAEQQKTLDMLVTMVATIDQLLPDDDDDAERLLFHIRCKKLFNRRK